MDLRLVLLADHTTVRRLNGDEETEEASGGCRQGDVGKAQANEEDLAREVGVRTGCSSSGRVANERFVRC